MNHPKREEWVSYLYGELRGQTRRQLKQHLKECAECRDEVTAWKRSLRSLNAWKLPRPAISSFAAPVLRWAAAAALVLCFGFGVGRLSAPHADLDQLRAQLEPRIRQEMRREVAAVVRQELDKASAVTLAQARRQAEEVGATYYALLKKDVDTLAINTDAGLWQTRRDLVQVADFKQNAASFNNDKR